MPLPTFRTPNRLRRLCLAAAAAPLLLAATGASAQGYPTKPVRLVVNFAAGGTTDVVARALAQPLAALLGQPVVVENRTGALGAIGANEVARAAPDGYTLLLSTQGSLTEIPVLSPKTPYDPVATFAPVTLIGESPLLLFAHPSFPANDVKGLIDYARSRPQGVDLAVSGSSVKLGAYALAGAGQFQITQIPYAGQGPVLNAVLGGHTALALNASTTALVQHVQAGRLKFIAVGSEQPYPLLPGVPPVAETLPGYTAKAWWGIFAPAGTPPEIVARLNQAFRQALASAGMEALFAENAMLPQASTPAELATLVQRGLETTRRLVAQHNIKEE